MGRPTKKRKTYGKRRITENPNPPQFSSGGMIVGQVSSDIISSILSPILNDFAASSVEEYADALLVYEQAVATQKLKDGLASTANDSEEVEVEDGEQVEIDLDGNIVQDSHSPKIDPILTTNLTTAPKTPLFATSQE